MPQLCSNALQHSCENLTPKLPRLGLVGLAGVQYDVPDAAGHLLHLPLDLLGRPVLWDAVHPESPGEKLSLGEKGFVGNKIARATYNILVTRVFVSAGVEPEKSTICYACMLIYMQVVYCSDMRKKSSDLFISCQGCLSAKRHP